MRTIGELVAIWPEPPEKVGPRQVFRVKAGREIWGMGRVNAIGPRAGVPDLHVGDRVLYSRDVSVQTEGGIDIVHPKAILCAVDEDVMLSSLDPTWRGAAGSRVVLGAPLKR
jgi:hypothetical protein